MINLIFFFFFLGNTGGTAICSCLPPEKISITAIENYSLIFTGEILEIEKEEGNYILEVKAEKIFRGISEDEFIKIKTPAGPGMCGINALVGQKWLIYAYDQNGFQTNICTRSRFIQTDTSYFSESESKLKEELDFLENLKNQDQ